MRCCQVLVLGVLLAAVAPRCAGAGQDDAVLAAIASLGENRQMAEDYVLQVKRKFKPDDPVHEESRRLYTAAAAKHNTWVAVVKMAIQRGKTKQLDKDRNYQSMAAQAEAANKAFMQYVEGAKGISRPRAASVAEFAGLGVKIWSGVKEQRARDRQEQAEQFERGIRWRHWDAVQPGGA